MPRLRFDWLLAAVVLSISASALALAPGAGAAELTVEVLGMRSGDGRVHFGLYDNPDTFPDKDGRLDGAETPILENRAVAVFKGIPAGQYAVAVFHDENANGEFDQGLFGLPLENYGFSNKALVFFGPPSFKNAAVRVPDKGLHITIRLD